ncbi:TPA: glycine cleavage system aminomethyltransferase GcvT [Candidatus Bathyarchaeota archaeon]|nr:glycine cleavage system aminomethyltransferase GcvT [Candidatus Bathyarchaeota archaeon]
MELRKTHIYQYHAEHGNVVDFGGYAMPVWYEGIIAEHKAVRDACGIFDTSHMGRVYAEGPDVVKFLDYVDTNDVAALTDGKGVYGVMCKPDGGIVDDLIVYRMSAEKFLVVYNAGNRAKDFAWLQKNTKGFKVKLTDMSDKVGMIAVQGPKAVEMLAKISATDPGAIERFNVAPLKVSGFDCLAARTGYTGEDGFELFILEDPVATPEKSLKVWNDLVAAGAKPCGLGARDSLRLEAGLWLYGNDIDETINPIEAGLKWVVKMKKPSYFNGRRALEGIIEKGVVRTLLGIQLTERGIPRHGYEVYDGEKRIGVVTSGGVAPTLDESIALAYLPPEYKEPGKEIQVKIRVNLVKGKIVKHHPFYDETKYGWKRVKA